MPTAETTRHVELGEHSTIGIECSADEAEALRSVEGLTVSRGPRPGSYTISSGWFVGVIRVGELQVTIHPKVGIDRLIFMIGYTNQPGAWHTDPVHLEPHSGLPEALAHAFALSAERALVQGPVRDYRTTEEAAPVLRGRVRVADQLKRRFGLRAPLELSYDEYTADTGENRVLLAAALKLIRLGAGDPTTRLRLHTIRVALADVTPPTDPLREGYTIDRRNHHLATPLALARLILAGHSFEHRIGHLRVSGYLFNMWQIFEDFISAGLVAGMKRLGGRPATQHRAYLDPGRHIVMRPDFVWFVRGAPTLVADVKYKTELPNDDFYQVLAYAGRYGLSEAHIIAPAPATASTHLTHARVTVHVHVIHLGRPPADLLGQLDELSLRFSRAGSAA